MNDIPPELESWLHPTPIPPRITITHHCGNCKYDIISEIDEPCINCIHNVDMRKDLWEPKGGKNE